jgi:anaerobic selenocysteine-containing dehydrogenase
VHADSWLPIRPATDAVLGLATARHIWETGRIDLPYVREQTDLPILVRLDTGRFLRGSDLERGGAEDILYLWDAVANAPAPAPGCQGSRQGKITLGELEPPIEGRFLVTLADGSEAGVAPVGSLLREQLAPFTFETAAELTGLHVDAVRRFAEGFAAAERPMILSSWGSYRYLHSDLIAPDPVSRPGAIARAPATTRRVGKARQPRAVSRLRPLTGLLAWSATPRTPDAVD